MGNLLLIFIAFCLFYLLTSGFRSSPQDRSWFKKELELQEAKYLVSLLAKVAKSDGRVNELEAELISQILDDITIRLGKDRSKREILKEIYNKEKENLSNTYAIAHEYRLKFKLDQNSAIAKLSFFLNLACIDGQLLKQEREIIAQIARGFRVDDEILSRLFDKFEKFYDQRDRAKSSYEANLNLKKDPYAVLNLPKSAEFSEVKRRYRELVKQYHPDILMGRGESEEIIERSTKKLQEINEAYEMIKRSFE